MAKNFPTYTRDSPNPAIKPSVIQSVSIDVAKTLKPNPMADKIPPNIVIGRQPYCSAKADAIGPDNRGTPEKTDPTHAVFPFVSPKT